MYSFANLTELKSSKILANYKYAASRLYILPYFLSMPCVAAIKLVIKYLPISLENRYKI